MIKNFSIIGGDLRIIELAKMLSSEDNNVFTFGLEQAEKFNNKNIINCKDIDEFINASDIIIGPIPFSKDGIVINTPFSNNKILISDFINKIDSKTFIAGSIKPNVYELAKNKNIVIIDLMERDDLAILNAIATAEGAISEAILNTPKILHKSKVLILGFGRIAKVLAQKLVGLSVDVTCAARKIQDLAWITSYGYNKTNINELGENLRNYDIIINTVPHIILDENRLQYVRKDCLIIDLASSPGGIDKKVAEEKGIKCITALAIPGKIAPITSAKFIKDIIYDILIGGI